MCVGECNFRQDGQEKPMVSICNSFPFTVFIRASGQGMGVLKG